MNGVLEICQTWLVQRYGECLPEKDDPFTWRRVSRDDFKSPIEMPDDDAPAILQDDEIGLLLIFVPIAEAWRNIQIRQKVEADLRGAISLRSLLLLKDTGKEEPDIVSDDGKGTWRVCIHWLVPNCHLQDVKSSLLSLRQKSSLFEEISVDIIGYKLPNFVNEALDAHRLPRLLLETRRVFNKPLDGIISWSGADAKIREVLNGFSSRFTHPTEKAIAESIERLSRDYKTTLDDHYPSKPQSLDRILIKNFRSIKHFSLEPWRNDRSVQSWVIHGPNGTGKTSLAEALSLYFFKTSSRYCDYLIDGDIKNLKNAKGYVSRYLKPIAESSGESAEEPCCGVGKSEIRFFADHLIGNKDDAKKALIREVEGTLSVQEDTGKFINLSGDELASRISRSFSKLAQTIDDHIYNGLQQSRNRRKQFFDKYGVGATAKDRKLIRSRIAQTHLSSTLPGLSQSNRAFINLLAKLDTKEKQKAVKLIEIIDIPSLIESTVKCLIDLEPSVKKEPFLYEIEKCFLRRYETLYQVAQLIQEFNSRRILLDADLPDIRNQAAIWANWLATQQQKKNGVTVVDANLKNLQDTLNKLSQERNKVAEKGQALRPQNEHIVQTKKFIEDHWVKEHADTCPTCRHIYPEGILNVIIPIHERLEEEINELRKKYNTLTQEMRNLENTIKITGQSQCPVSQESRERIDSVMRIFLNTPNSVEEFLVSSDTRPLVLSLLEYIQTPPTGIGDLRDPVLESQLCAETIMEQWNMADSLADEPDAWESVRKLQMQLFKSVVEEHLPSTIQTVWWEIAASLTPALWLLPDKISFRPEVQRNEQRLDIVIGDRMARYLLNNAEKHTLGLAWFFTQHMIKGRFRNSWLLLDDPAQEMDQPTFRELCRFLATLMRLYEFKSTSVINFTLVLLLHQEERALDAARETDSGLYQLGWSKIQTDQDKQTVRRMLLAGPTFHSPSPEAIFTKDSRTYHS